MKPAVAAFRELLVQVVGLEGFLIVLGTVLLAIGAGYLSPAGPWIVAGGVAFLIGLAIAVPRSR